MSRVILKEDLAKSGLKLFSAYSVEKLKKMLWTCLQDGYRKHDAVMEEAVGSLIISMNNDSSDSEAVDSGQNSSSESEDDFVWMTVLNFEQY